MHTTYGHYIILLYYESIHSNTRLYSMHTTTVCILADEKASEERKVSFFAHPHSEWNTVKEFVDRSHPTIYMWRLFFGAGRRCHAVAAVAATMGLYGEGAPLSCESSSGVSSAPLDVAILERTRGFSECEGAATVAVAPCSKEVGHRCKLARALDGPGRNSLLP